MVAADPAVSTPADGAAEEAVITLSSQLPSKAGAEAAVEEHAERRRFVRSLYLILVLA